MLFLKKLTILLFLTSSAIAGQSIMSECLEVRDIVEGAFDKVTCKESFHHYNSSSHYRYYSKKRAIQTGKVRIASFNAYQVGTVGTEYKDYEIVAKIINNWDVVSVLELLPNIGVFRRHNESLMSYYKKLRVKLEQATSQRGKDKVLREIAKVKGAYELPGYLKILEELRKIDQSWSLVLSGTKEGTSGATFKELTGFYYRGTIVQPLRNKYCSEAYNESAYGCTIKFSEDFYGRDVSELIARRPMIAKFKSGEFDFDLVASHIIYNPPSSNELMKKIVKEAFGANHFDEVGPGVAYDTYARFAEVKHTLNFIKKYKQIYGERDVIYQGDLNLESDNEYWPILLRDFPDLKLKIQGPTSLSRARELSDGTLTHGVKSNFDHFLVNTADTAECSGRKSARTFNFLENSIKSLVDSRYLVRDETTLYEDENEISRYRITEDGQAKAQSLIDSYSHKIANKLTYKGGKLIRRFDIGEKTQDMIDKIFEPQLLDRTYYRIYLEIVSDHLPIFMNCKNDVDLD